MFMPLCRFRFAIAQKSKFYRVDILNLATILWQVNEPLWAIKRADFTQRMN
jgi:hypothetical protein